MYFHPLILTEAQKQQRAAACRDDARPWLDDIDPQHWWHTDAVFEVYVKQQEGLWASDSIDLTRSVVRCRARAAPARLDLLQISARATEIVADGHRKVVATLELGAKVLSRSLDQRDGRDASPPTDLREHATLRGKERA